MASTSNGIPKEKTKSKADKELDLANSARGVWLVKVPKYISDRWEKAAANTEVGKLRLVFLTFFLAVDYVLGPGFERPTVLSPR